MDRRLPSRKAIKEHWRERLVGLKFDSDFEYDEADYCFGCGMYNGPTQRAHIVARCISHDDSAENIHLLCAACHKDSEFLDAEKYWDWFNNGGIFSGLGAISSRIVAIVGE